MIRTTRIPTRTRTKTKHNETVTIEAINREQRLGILDTNEIFSFDTLYDRYGEETDEIDEYGYAVAQLADGKWIVVEFKNFPTEHIRVH